MPYSHDEKRAEAHETRSEDRNIQEQEAAYRFHPQFSQMRRGQRLRQTHMDVGTCILLELSFRWRPREN